ncbi:MAG: Gfo/Idh/MocA family oxidoreductase [Planctomycetes bacterium]|nr:Gfo/Idh/MocA family oxidoreductase [Planctomycetota bacterium]
MIRLGFVAGSGFYHAVQFAKMFNGFNEEFKDLDPCGGSPPMAEIDGAQVVKVFDEDRQAAENLAKFANIPEVVDSLDDVVEGVDAVYIGDDLTLTQYKYASTFIERGMPIFIDKPLADNFDAAREIVDLARNKNCLVMSSSALKYAKEVEPIQNGEEDIGDIAMACTMGPANLKYGRAFLFYGMHSVTLGHCLIKSRPVEVVDVGDRGRTVVRVRYMNGAMLTVMCPDGVAVRFQGLFQGQKGSFYTQVADAGHFYSTMLKDFLAMVEKGEQTFDLDEALEVIQICCAAEESVRTGRAVRLG